MNIPFNVFSAKCYLFSILLGYYFPEVLFFLGIMNGMEAVQYYGEVHLSFWNSLIHTFFMPITYLGLNIAVPSLVLYNPMKNRYAEILQWSVYLVYMTYYATINLHIAIITTVIYFYSVKFATYFYNPIKRMNINRIEKIALGLIISGLALSIQESFGHYIGGDDPSRLEGILNAVLHSKFYSSGHYLYNLHGGTS